MKIEIITKDIEISEGHKTAITNTVSEIESYFTRKELEVEVIVSRTKVGMKCEMSLFVDHNHTFRQETTDEDLYAAIDLTGKKIETQIIKIKERVATDELKKEALNEMFSAKALEKTEEITNIVRRKLIDNKPMSEDDAIIQFELSGHDFFVFEDLHQGNRKVLYKRRDGEYGVLEINE